MGNCQDSENQVRSMKVVPPKSVLFIKCHTWKKDYQGLYDYQSKQIQKEELKVNQSGVIFKEKNSSFGFIPCDSLSVEVMKAMGSGLKFSVSRKSRLKGFGINSVKVVQNNEVVEKSIWEVVKTMPNKKYALQEGDIIKLGRQKFKVKEKVLKEESADKEEEQKNHINKNSIYKNLTKESSQQVYSSQSNEADQITCRVCLDPGATDNPIITPCNCQGDLSYIHLSCLKTWLGKRLEPIVRHHSVVINWKPLVCELCTSPFLYKVYMDGKKYYTVQIPRPEKPYIVLQILNKCNKNDKYYNLISFAQKEKLRLGRKHDIDVRISDDISVSRNHASIAYDPQTSDFFLEDNSSKFGTLVLQKKFRIYDKTSTMFQVGPNLFSLKMVKGLDEPLVDQFSDSEKQSIESSDESYDESDDSQQNQEIQPQDLSPTIPKKVLANEDSRPTVLLKQPLVSRQQQQQIFNSLQRDESISSPMKIESKNKVQSKQKQKQKQEQKQESKKEQIEKQKQQQPSKQKQKQMKLQLQQRQQQKQKQQIPVLHNNVSPSTKRIQSE